ncbi:amidohydrolase family protein [candidate division KSB1 bacterium]
MKKYISILIILVLGIISFNQIFASEKSEVYRRIKSAVDNIWMVDTHEHLMTEKERLSRNIDFFELFSQYTSSDLISSGMPRGYFGNKEETLEERWEKFYPYWKKMRNTGYAKCILVAVRDLFGIDDINENTYREINRKIIESNKKGGWYKHVLKDKAKIDVSLLDVLNRKDKGLSEINGEYFVRVRRFEDRDFNFVQVSPKTLPDLEIHTGIKIRTLEDLLSALDTAFQKAINEENIVGVKIAIAYSRKIQFDDVPKIEAEQAFNKMFKYKETLSKEETTKFQDFLIHQVIEHAIKYDLPIQIHTGLQTGSGNIITNSKPTHLVNLFMKYRKAKFDIFHGSYPYMGELATLAKNFQNVYIDMCWMHIISPSASKRYLEEWLETVPSNKILAYGGDYLFVEGAYGHAVMAREIVAEVLTKKVEEGYFSEKEAITIAKRILRDNAIELFKLKKIGNRYQKK